MKKTMIWLTMACALMSILACGSEEDWSEEEVAEAYAEADIFATDAKSLSKHVQQRYRCRCQLDANTCPHSHPFAVVKQNTCRYKRDIDRCVGKCNGRCANQNGAIYRPKKLAGRCIKVKVRPNGAAGAILTDCKGRDLACIDDSDDDTVEDVDFESTADMQGETHL